MTHEPDGRAHGQRSGDVPDNASERVIKTAHRVQIVANTILSVCALLATMLGVWSFMNKTAQAQEVADVKRLDAADARMQDQLRTVVEIVNLQATLQIEQPGSAEYAHAVEQLRAMRKIIN